MIRQWITGALALSLSVGLLGGCAQQEQSALTLQVALVGQAQQLDPIYTTQTVEQTILANVNDTLMAQSTGSDGTVEAVGALAKTVKTTANEDGTTTYTFTLRSADWSDGEAVTGDDFVYAWKRLADPANSAPYTALLSTVDGYDLVQSTANPDLLNVSAPSKSTFQVVVTGETDWFLNEVCTSVATTPVRQDMVQGLSGNYTDLVTCGPYTVTQASDECLTLTANDDYYGTDPIAQEIQVLLAPDAQTALTWFEEGTVSFMDTVPETTYQELTARETNQTTANLLDMTYVAINHTDGILQDPLVRQALFLSVDFTALLDAVGYPAQAAQGIVPLGIQEDGQESQIGFRHAGSAMDTAADTYGPRKASAKIALGQSTYPTEDADYTLELLYVNQDDNQTTAKTLAQQWKTLLGITVTPVATTQVALDTAMAEGTYQLCLATLPGIVNDPELYLSPWTSENPNNLLHYSDTAYDTLLSIAVAATETSGRMGCLHDAEALLLEDYALLPLYSNIAAWQLAQDMTGLLRDSRGWFSFESLCPRTI